MSKLSNPEGAGMTNEQRQFIRSLTIDDVKTYLMEIAADGQPLTAISDDMDNGVAITLMEQFTGTVYSAEHNRMMEDHGN